MKIKTDKNRHHDEDGPFLNIDRKFMRFLM